MKKAVVTLVVGEDYEKIAKITHPSIKKYAKKIGADFIILNGKYKTRRWNKFEIYNLFKKYNRIIYTDTDLVIRDDCPDLFEIVPEQNIGLFEESKFSPLCQQYIADGQRVYGEEIDWDGKYYNTGVMVISRYHRELFIKPSKSVIEERHFRGEQTYLNLRLQTSEVEITNLHYKFNRMSMMDEFTGEPRLASYIIHYAGCPEVELMLQLIKKDLSDWQDNVTGHNYKRNIVFSVGGGIGDQICAEPAIRYAMEKLWPGHNFWILSNWPLLFRHLGVPVELPEFIFDKSVPYLVLNSMPKENKGLWNYITTGFCHVVDFAAMSICSRVLADKDKQIKLKIPLVGISELLELVGKKTLDQGLFLLHPGLGWPSKTFPKSWWEELASELVKKKIPIAIIGKRVSDDQGYVDIKCPEGAIDLRDLLSLGGLMAALNYSRALISNCSGPVHLAGAFNNWIILIPTCKHPDHVLPYRMGSKQHKTMAIYKKLTIDTLQTDFVEGEIQTLDKIIGDITDYLPDVSQVVDSVVRTVCEEEKHEKK